MLLHMVREGRRFPGQPTGSAKVRGSGEPPSIATLHNPFYAGAYAYGKAGRGGRALLAGLLRCRRCGRMLSVAYTTRGGVARYVCRIGHAMHGLAPCIGVGARRPDELVAAEVLGVVEPMAVEAALTAMDLAEQQTAEQGP